MGYGYGLRGYKVRTKRGTDGEAVVIPNNILLGPHSSRIFYPGQTTRCYICDAMDHQVKDCKTVTCWRCSEFGHKSRDCTSESKCTPCNGDGLTYFNCPQAYSNRAKNGGRVAETEMQQPMQPVDEPQIPQHVPKQDEQQRGGEEEDKGTERSRGETSQTQEQQPQWGEQWQLRVFREEPSQDTSLPDDTGPAADWSTQIEAHDDDPPNLASTPATSHLPSGYPPLPPDTSSSNEGTHPSKSGKK